MQNGLTYDVIIIGAGPGGYTAAIRAAQLGFRVAIADRRAALGGTCLNVGCIPAKALLDATELYASLRDRAKQQGIRFNNLWFDVSAAMKYKKEAVDRLTRGVELLMRQHNITVFRGEARLVSPQAVEVSPVDGTAQTLSGRHIILATGSAPAPLPAVPCDGDRVVYSDDALSFACTPESLVVIGAGAVGLEIGSIWLRLGAKVTVVEAADRILPGMDRQAGRSLMQALERQGMAFSLSTAIQSCSLSEKTVELKGTKGSGGDAAFSAERVLVAVGRKPVTDGMGLKEIGIHLNDRGRVRVNERFQTTVPGVYAIGDIIEGPMLAHKASEEGIAAVELLAGKAGFVDYGMIPNVVYTWPELATIGKTEEDCKTASIPVRKGRFYFRANGRSITSGNTEGFAAILAHRDTDRVLGAAILGPWSSDLIHEIAAVMEFGGSAEDLARTLHAHPTLSEAVREAAMDVDGRAIHVPPGLKINKASNRKE